MSRFNFPYWKIGFKDDEWSYIPNAVKRNIKDYFIARGNKETAIDFCFFETDFSVRRLENLYGLHERYPLHFNAETMEFA